MTEEADARARLVIHYEDRLVMLAKKLQVAEVKLEICDSGRRATPLKSQVQRLKRELTDTREKVRRVREAIASGGA